MSLEPLSATPTGSQLPEGLTNPTPIYMLQVVGRGMDNRYVNLIVMGLPSLIAVKFAVFDNWEAMGQAWLEDHNKPNGKDRLRKWYSKPKPKPKTRLKVEPEPEPEPEPVAIDFSPLNRIMSVADSIEMRLSK